MMVVTCQTVAANDGVIKCAVGHYCSYESRSRLKLIRAAESRSHLTSMLFDLLHEPKERCIGLVLAINIYWHGS